MHNTANRIIIHNFLVLCTKYFFEGREDLQMVHEKALVKLLLYNQEIKPCDPVLHVTKFDGINTRNKVIKLLQFNTDLDEVVVYKNKNFDYCEKMNDYVNNNAFLKTNELSHCIY